MGLTKELRRARELWMKADIPGCLKLLDGMLFKFKEHPDVISLRSSCEFYSTRLNAAWMLASSVVSESKTPSLLAHLTRGQVFRVKPSHKEGEESLVFLSSTAERTDEKKEKDPFKLTILAIGLLLCRNTEYSLSFAERAVSLYSENVLARNCIAAVYKKKKMPERMIETYTEAISVNPTYANLYLNRANVHKEKGNLKKAVEDYSQAVSLQSSHYAALVNRGNSYFLLGEFSKAVDDFTAAINCREEGESIPIQIVIMRAQANATMENWDLVSYDVDRVLGEKPEYVPALIQKAEMFDMQEKWKESMAQWTEVMNQLQLQQVGSVLGLTESQRWGKAFLGRAVAKLKLGKYRDALGDLDNAISAAPSVWNLYLVRGKLYVGEAKRYRRDRKRYLSLAVKDLGKCIQRNRECAEAYYKRGRIFTDIGDSSSGNRDLSKAIDMDSTNPSYYYWRALAREDVEVRTESDKDGIISDYTTAIQYWNESDKTEKVRKYLGDAHYRRAMFQYEHRESADGRGPEYENLISAVLEDLDSAVETDPHHSLAFHARGQLYQEELKQPDKAIESYNRAMDLPAEKVLGKSRKKGKLQSSKTMLHIRRGTSFYFKGDIKKALEDYSKAVEIDPDDWVVHFERGKTYYDERQYEKAIEDYSEAIRLNNTSSRCYAARAKAYLTNGDFRLAKNDVQKVLELDTLSSEGYIIRTKLALEERNYDDALTYVNHLTTIDPKNIEGLILKGEVHSARGEHATATVSFTTTLELCKETVKDPESLRSFEEKLFLRRGIAREKNGDEDSAILDLSECLDRNPKQPLALSHRARVKYQRGEVQGAFPDYVSALDILRQHSDDKLLDLHFEVLCDFGDALSMQDQLDEAILRYSSAIQLIENPSESTSKALKNVDISRAYFGRALVFKRLGKGREANRDYHTAISACPGNTFVYYSQWANVMDDENVLQNEADKEDGIFDKIVDLASSLNVEVSSPGTSRATLHVQRGNSYYLKGKFDKAIDDYTSAIRSEPRDWNAYNNRGVLYQRKHMYEEAIADFTKAISINPRYANAYLNRGIVYARKAELEKAASDYTEAIGINPTSTEAYYNRGLVYMKMDMILAAVEDFTTALRFTPDEADVYTNRASARFRLGQIGSALADYDQAIILQPESVSARHNRANLYIETGEFDKAIVDLEVALLMNPRHASSHYNRGVVYHNLGEFNKAIDDFSMSIELSNGQDIDALFNRGLLYRTKGEYERSLRDFYDVVKLAPNDPEAYNNRGYAFLQCGRLEEAHEDFRTVLRIDPNHVEAFRNKTTVEEKIGSPVSKRKWR